MSREQRPYNIDHVGRFNEMKAFQFRIVSANTIETRAARDSAGQYLMAVSIWSGPCRTRGSEHRDHRNPEGRSDMHRAGIVCDHGGRFREQRRQIPQWDITAQVDEWTVRQIFQPFRVCALTRTSYHNDWTMMSLVQLIHNGGERRQWPALCRPPCPNIYGNPRPVH
jgi:hypothetical protein